MSDYICSVCGEKFKYNGFFDKEQNKCFLHCDKLNEKDYSEFYILLQYFIRDKRINTLEINKSIDSLDNYFKEGYLVFKNVVFPNNNSCFKWFDFYDERKILFEKCTFLDSGFHNLNLEKLKFNDCLFYSKKYPQEVILTASKIFFSSLECKNFDFSTSNTESANIIIRDSNFEELNLVDLSLEIDKVKVKNKIYLYSFSNKNQKIIIKNNSFINKIIGLYINFDLLSIIDSFICDIVFFPSPKINNLNIQNSTLENGIDLNNSIIKDRLSLINSKIKNKKFDLSNTSLPSNMNFLNAKLEVENRETARIIKDSFDRQNNFIEANKYYAIEMKHFDNELMWTKDNLKEKLIFKFHDWSSEHSQNWVLPLFWILLFSMGYGVIEYLFFGGNKLVDESLYANILGILFIVLSIPFIIDNILENKGFKKYFSSFIFFTIGFYLYITNDLLLELAAKAINPFSIMYDGDSINGIQLIFKIIITYLIYQLIISIRQNTRRK